MQRQSDYVAAVRRFTILLVCVLALLAGAAAPARADVATSLGFKPVYEPFMAVDPVGQHVFVAGGEATSSIYVFDFDGNLVKTITNENGASGMAVDTATHTLYVALFDATKISEIDTQTLTETTRFTVPADTYDVALAGGKLWLATANQVNSTIDYANLDGSDITSAGFGDIEPALLASSPNGTYLAFGDHETEPPTLAIYDVSGATPTLVNSVWDPNNDSGSVADLAFDPSGSNLYMASGAPYQIQTFANPGLTLSAQYPTGPYPDAVAVSQDGSYVAGGVGSGQGSDVFLYPTGDTTPVQTWRIGDGSVMSHSLAISPDDTRLFALTSDPVTGDLVFEVLGDTEITSGPATSTYAATASFAFTSRDSNATFQCSLDDSTWQACTSPASYPDLGIGSHTFAVKNTDLDPDDPISATQTWTVKAPTTYLNGGPSDPTTSTDASFSFSSDDQTATFQCKLDDADWTACSSPATYSGLSVGSHTFAVRAVNDAGGVDPTGATQTWEIEAGPPTPPSPPTPPPGAVGISINNGDYATNSPDVNLDVIWPLGATLALISNDGGFGPSGNTQTVPVADLIPWTLQSEGSAQLPQIVYLRFPDSANPTETFTDNIVLDTTTPTVSGAAVTSSKHHRYKVRLQAKDKLSGISAVRFSATHHGGTTVQLRDRRTRGVLKLSRTITVKMSARPKWVRVDSTAGDWSKWHRVR